MTPLMIATSGGECQQPWPGYCNRKKKWRLHLFYIHSLNKEGTGWVWDFIVYLYYNLYLGEYVNTVKSEKSTLCNERRGFF